MGSKKKIKAPPGHKRKARIERDMDPNPFSHDCVVALPLRASPRPPPTAETQRTSSGVLTPERTSVEFHPLVPANSLAASWAKELSPRTTQDHPRLS